MCQLCDNGEMPTCNNCGKWVCCDCKNCDDIIRPAFVSSDGDLYCDRCGQRHERDLDDEYDKYMDDMDILE
jgi:hypothetical protein